MTSSEESPPDDLDRLIDEMRKREPGRLLRRDACLAELRPILVKHIEPMTEGERHEMCRSIRYLLNQVQYPGWTEKDYDDEQEAMRRWVAEYVARPRDFMDEPPA